MLLNRLFIGMFVVGITVANRQIDLLLQITDIYQEPVLSLFDAAEGRIFTCLVFDRMHFVSGWDSMNVGEKGVLFNY